MTKEILARAGNRTIEHWTDPAAKGVEMWLNVIRGERGNVLSCRPLTYASTMAAVQEDCFTPTAIAVREFGLPGIRHQHQRRLCVSDVRVSGDVHD